ncbi:MAG: hypothetical protein KF832_08585 [Caldilineaceae bacterium]|nr:hypothetical protein [Caldilineaceae bacterium]
MQNLETLKTKSQASLNRLVEFGKQQPAEVQMLGVVGAAAVAGGVAAAAVAKGVLGVVSLLASPSIALTVGAVGGGLIGWSLMQEQKPTPEAAPAEAAPTVVAVSEAPVLAAV